MTSSSIPFEEYTVRVLLGDDRNIAWVCLQDLCQILQRPQMINDEQMLSLCPTREQIPFRKRGRSLWGISPFDVYKLLRPIRRESAAAAEICSRVEAWLNALLERAAVRASAAAVTAQEPVIFNYQDKIPVSFIAANGKLMINITPISKGFGVVPAMMLNRADIMRYRRELVEKGISESLESQVFTLRGSNHGATWVEVSLAIEYARVLSPEFSLWCNDCVSEVMTMGLVAADGTGGGNLPILRNLDDARKLILQQREQIEMQQNQLEETHHKVEFYDNIIENRDFFTTTFIASELDVSAFQLHTFLMENNICIREKNQWVALSPYRLWQCDAPFYRTNKRGKRVAALKRKRWSKLGREQILELWRTQLPKIKILPAATHTSQRSDHGDAHYKSSDLADELNITPYRLHHFLAAMDVCYFKSTQWVVFPQYASWQCNIACYRTCRTNKKGESIPTNSRKRWTELGREKIFELWCRHNPQGW